MWNFHKIYVKLCEIVWIHASTCAKVSPKNFSDWEHAFSTSHWRAFQRVSCASQALPCRLSAVLEIGRAPQIKRFILRQIWGTQIRNTCAMEEMFLVPTKWLHIKYYSLDKELCGSDFTRPGCGSSPRFQDASLCSFLHGSKTFTFKSKYTYQKSLAVDLYPTLYSVLAKKPRKADPF